MPDMSESDSATLARIDERTQAQGVTLANHIREDGEKFEKVFSFVSKRFDKMEEHFDKVDMKFETMTKKFDESIASTNLKVEPLQTESVRRKGQLDISRTAVMAGWALAVVLISHFWK